MTLREIARKGHREYVTPEDVQGAIDAGADRLETYVELLGQIEARNVEDVSCACFVAREWRREKVVDSEID